MYLRLHYLGFFFYKLSHTSDSSNPKYPKIQKNFQHRYNEQKVSDFGVIPISDFQI